jgi:flagella basal body P-ring formation protein FlgA
MKHRVHSSLVVLLFALLIGALGTAGARAQGEDGRLHDALRELIERRAVDLAVEQVAPPDRFTILSYRVVSADPVPAGRMSVEALEVEGPNHAGIVRVHFRTLLDEEPWGEARAMVRGKVRGPALVALRALRKGEPIGTDDVEVSEQELTRLREEPLRRFEQVRGLVPDRTVGAGRALLAGMLRPQPVVRRGEIVSLKVERPGLVASTQGTALLDGAAGETVPAKNNATGAEVLARVLPDGSLLVVRGPIQGRRRR